VTKGPCGKCPQKGPFGECPWSLTGNGTLTPPLRRVINMSATTEYFIITQQDIAA